ncbi:MAG TPA: hypothetical protein PK185_02625 [Cyclobacteriaceae bacterium]|nr:hypothetical protein [Cyclobacteriaceae bacterium]
MKYELEHIERKVKEAIQSDDPDVLDQFSNSLSQEVNSILKAIQIHVINFNSAKELRQYIQYHQQSLILQLDEIDERIQSTSNDIKFGEAICLQLEKVLDFLRINYPKQFLYNSVTPKSYARRIKKELLPQLDTVGTAMIGCSIGPNAKEAFRNILSDITDQLELQPRFTVLLQSEYLVKEFKIIDLDDCDCTWLEEQIGSLFLKLNVNSDLIQNHFIQYFRSESQRAESLTEQIDKMAGFLKYLNQTPVRSEFVNNEYSLPLRETLANWVYEELHFMSRKYQMTIVPEAHKGGLQNNFKIDFDMSVSQFACFTKTLVGAGIIQNKNVSELIRFLASSVKTKRSENISHESFRMKYYNIESNTKNAVKNLLHSAIGHINTD